MINPVLLPHTLRFHGAVGADQPGFKLLGDRKSERLLRPQTAPCWAMTSFAAGQCELCGEMLAPPQKHGVPTNRPNLPPPCRSWLMKQRPFHRQFWSALLNPSSALSRLARPGSTINWFPRFCFHPPRLFVPLVTHRECPSCWLRITTSRLISGGTAGPPSTSASTGCVNTESRRSGSRSTEPVSSHNTRGTENDREAGFFAVVCAGKERKAHCEALCCWRRVAVSTQQRRLR
jgi:hypothetical protein